MNVEIVFNKSNQTRMIRTQLSSVLNPSVEESTDDDDHDSEESEIEKTIRKTIKATIFNQPIRLRRQSKKVQEK